MSKVVVIFLGIILLFFIFIFSYWYITRPSEVLITSFEKHTNNYIPAGVTLDSIFSLNHSWVATLSADKITTLIATGDIIPARSVNSQTVSRNNYKWPYEKTKEIIENADISFGNLETPLIKKCPVTQEGMIFCGDVKNIEGLVFSGIDIVSLANNHASNYGEKGVIETIEELKKSGIKITGINGMETIEKNGITFAFLGYNDISSPQTGISNASFEKIKTEIAFAKKNADVVIVTYHWGAEYRSQPDERQKELGKYTIDSGADLVIGNHPHWVQPVELYKGKLITYAHGNYIFDQMWSDETKIGVLGKYTFYENQLIDVEYIPIKIEYYGQPYVLNGVDKEKILESMKEESIILSGRN